MTTQPLLRRIFDCIAMAKADGAQLVRGGTRANRPECGNGWFVELTVFTNVTNDIAIAQTEVFGPVLSILTLRDEEEAWALANDTSYGLAAGVWATDQCRMFLAAKKLRAGMVCTNCYRPVSYMSPFGGFKNSGQGREKGSWRSMNIWNPRPSGSIMVRVRPIPLCCAERSLCAGGHSHPGRFLIN